MEVLGHPQIPSKTAEKILEAATRVFTTKGFAGTRMEEIAAASGINRALLNYYYRSKETLFEVVFSRHFIQMQSGMGTILSGNMTVEEKIRGIVQHYHKTITQNPSLPLFVIQELSVNPDRVLKMMRIAMGSPENHAAVFIRQVDQEGRDGKIRKIDGAHLLVSVFAMVMYPFIGRPILKMVLRKDEGQYESFIDERPDFIINTILQSLKP